MVVEGVVVREQRNSTGKRMVVRDWRGLGLVGLKIFGLGGLRGRGGGRVVRVGGKHILKIK